MLFIKGFFIGIAKIIPGVSGSIIAITLGVYEKSIDAIANLFTNFKSNIKYLTPLGLGAFLSIILTSNLIVWLLNNFYNPTMALFIGLIAGGIPGIYIKSNLKNYKSFISFIFSFSFVFMLTYIGELNLFENSNWISYFFIGIIDALTMIIPGISGTAVMMILGCYDMLLNLLSNINISHFIPFILGVAITILLMAKLISYLFKKHTSIIYASILGFTVGAIIFLLMNLSFTNFLISILMLSAGYLIGKRF